MEVLDSTAGSVAYKHVLGPDAETIGTIREQGFYVVTASVDRCGENPRKEKGVI